MRVESAAQKIAQDSVDSFILLMEEILHQSIWWISQYLQGFIHVNGCRISAINSSNGFRKPGFVFFHSRSYKNDLQQLITFTYQRMFTVHFQGKVLWQPSSVLYMQLVILSIPPFERGPHRVVTSAHGSLSVEACPPTTTCRLGHQGVNSLHLWGAVDVKLWLAEITVKFLIFDKAKQELTNGGMALLNCCPLSSFFFRVVCQL